MSIQSTCEATPDLRLFAENLNNTAEWRREKSKQFNDAQNDRAADLLDDLADQLRDLEDQELVPLSSVLTSCGYAEVEVISEYISRIGFDHFPANAKELVSDLAAELTGEDA